MRLVAISDTHGRHAELTLPEGDVLIHTGDFSRRGRVEELEDFNAWLGEQPFRHRIIIAGNHDWLFERDNAHARALITNAIYLEDSGCELAGLRFWGSPWTPVFFDWAFNLPRGEGCRAKWRQIPTGTDVVVTHGPPLGHGDLCSSGLRAGCLDLLDELTADVERPGGRVVADVQLGLPGHPQGAVAGRQALSDGVDLEAGAPVALLLPQGLAQGDRAAARVAQGQALGERWLHLGVEGLPLDRAEGHAVLDDLEARQGVERLGPVGVRDLVPGRAAAPREDADERGDGGRTEHDSCLWSRDPADQREPTAVRYAGAPPEEDPVLLICTRT